MMSIRANSLQSVLLDGVYFAALMGLTAVSIGWMSPGAARGAEPQVVQTGDIATDRRLTDDHIDSQLNTDDNMPSGDPTESPEAKREAMMLGMKLVERSEGNIHVDDVAATSPAWDAGIRRGDRLLSIDGIKPKTLSKWVEDLGSVLKDTPDGHAVATEVERDGEKLALRIRVPVSKAAEVRDARQEERALAEMAATNQQQQMPLGQQGVQPIASAGEPGGAGYGPGYGVGGWGIGGFFDDEDSSRRGNNNAGDDRMANRAIAQLMAVNTLSGGANNQAGQLQNTQATNMPSTGGQVGLAAFQNTNRGVSAIVVVRGLPQGTYRVGIGQGGPMTGGFGSGGVGTGAMGTNFNANGVQNPTRQDGQQMNTRNRDGRQLNRGDVPQPNMNQPVPGAQRPVTPAQPSGSGQPAGAAAGAADGASLANPRSSAILAQQMDAQQLQGAQNGNPGVAPGTFPNDQTGSGNPSGADNGTVDDINPANANNNIRPTPLGILRVGPDGSGRLETVLEGVQVRSLVGMSVSVFSDMAAGSGPMGTNAQGIRGGFGNGNQNVGTNQPIQQPQQNTPGAMRNGRNAGQVQGNSLPSNQMPGGLNGGSAQGIVATGVVQLMEGNGQNLGQQRGNLFPVDQRDPNQAAPQDGNRGQISNPQEDFDPSQVE